MTIRTKSYHYLHMNESEALEQYFAICKRVYERMERDGTWPWAEQEDSSNSEDLVELNDKSNEL